MDIVKIIKPKNTLEEKIIRDQEFIDGVNWGKPRKGHPEGTVLAHIQEVLANVDKYGNGMTEDPLRIITLIHDTFKYKVDRSFEWMGHPPVSVNVVLNSTEK